MNDAVEMALFRILQESLTNVYRHSGSKTADVRLDLANCRVTMTVKDSGGGMSATALAQFQRTGRSTGVGLVGMRERLKEFGGELHISSGTEGTIVKAVVPLTGISLDEKAV